MTKLLTTLLFVLASTGVGHAQRSVPARVLETFRPIGELRVWTFMQGDSTIGTLTSRIDRTIEISDFPGYVIVEDLSLDYTKIGAEHKLEVSGEHYIGAAGIYLGDKLKVHIGGQEGQIDIKRDGGMLTGNVGRADDDQDVYQPLPGAMFAVDNHMVDQYELFFAMRGLKEGETVDDSVFVPRDLAATPIRGEVIGWTWQQLYKGVFDSVFVVRLTHPSPMELFINASLHLRKINIPTQDMRVYLDVVRQGRPAQGPQPISLRRMVKLIPGYIMFALIGLIGLGLYAGGEIRAKVVWLTLLAGGVVFLPAALIQLPVQNYLFESWYRPAVEGGGSIILWGVLAVLPAGFIQEGLKLLGIYLIDRLRKAEVRSTVAVGAAVGAGLGIIEACYLESVAGDTDLFTWALLQRAFFILFHATTGALIGQGYGGKGRTLWFAVGLAVVSNIILRLLPIMVQTGMAAPELVNIITGVLVVILMLWAVIWQRRAA